MTVSSTCHADSVTVRWVRSFLAPHSLLGTVYAQWLRRPELIDGLFAPTPAECGDPERVPQCAALTRVWIMTFVGYWTILILCHSVSHRLMGPYRKTWGYVQKVGWCTGCTAGIGSLYLSINAFLVLRTPAFSLEAGSHVLVARAHDLDSLMA
jgi:hypothetical protein